MENKNLSSMILPDTDIFSNKETTETNQFVNNDSHSQVQKTLPREVEPSWTLAKSVHTEAVRFDHRANFLQGAINNGVTETWAFQLERIPNFLTRLPGFRNEYYALRLKHAKETMEMAVKHLRETATADRRTSKTMKMRLTSSLNKPWGRLKPR